MSTKVRPTGVTILAILEIISGVIAIAFGAFFGTLMGSMGIGMMMGEGEALGAIFAAIGGIVIALGAIFAAIGGIVIALGAISFVLAWGLLKGKSWAWTVTLILTIISLVFDLPSMNIIGIIIDVVILYYLFRPHVKTYFGKESQVL